MAELKDIEITIKQRGKKGRWLKAKSYKATEFIGLLADENKFAEHKGKLKWYDKKFKTKKYMDHWKCHMYNLGIISTFEAITNKLKKIKK
jgi:hypothetical protein